MRQSHVVVATVFATLAATAAVPAQTKPEAQSKPAAAQPAPALSSKPYSRLFDSARRFICAMPILPADSAIDPRFEMRPHDTTTQFSMHVVAPGQCQ